MGELRIESAARTDVGLVREHNEDSLVVDAELGLYAVCDGMGGHLGGEVASGLAAQRMAELLRSDKAPAPDEPDRLVSAIRAANRAIYDRSRTEPSLRNMGTTVVAARREGDRLHLCHVGDSRMYRLRGGSFEQLTRDHSLANLYKDNPELAARFGPAQSSVIVRAVGLQPELEVDHRTVALQAADRYLLCSDGLTDMLGDSELAELMDAPLDSLDELCGALIRAALARGGVDNTTAVVLRVEP